MTDPQREIAELKHALSDCIPWVATCGRGKAQGALARACELIGVHPLSWSAHPEVLLRRRPDLDRRKTATAKRSLPSPDSSRVVVEGE